VQVLVSGSWSALLEPDDRYYYERQERIERGQQGLITTRVGDALLIGMLSSGRYVGSFNSREIFQRVVRHRTGSRRGLIQGRREHSTTTLERGGQIVRDSQTTEKGNQYVVTDPDQGLRGPVPEGRGPDQPEDGDEGARGGRRRGRVRFAVHPTGAWVAAGLGNLLGCGAGGAVRPGLGCPTRWRAPHTYLPSSTRDDGRSGRYGWSGLSHGHHRGVLTTLHRGHPIFVAGTIAW